MAGLSDFEAGNGAFVPECSGQTPPAFVDQFAFEVGEAEFQPACDMNPVYGCTDPTATNYNPAATHDDGSCSYPPANQPPVVSAGPDRTTLVGNAITLAGSATDDGLPTPTNLTVAWTQDAGPAAAAFSSTSVQQPSVTFSIPGSYTLRLTASDGALSAFDTMQAVATLSDGARPYSGLTLASDGNFYGTTFQGGSVNVGTVYRLSPSGAYQTLAAFRGSNGASPYAAPILASDGNLYGTTYDGGSAFKGSIYKLTPGGILSTLYSFTSPGPAFPQGPLIQAPDGTLWGVTSTSSPATQLGAVFKISLSGTFSFIANIAYSGTYYYGRSGLILASDGNFYGSAQDAVGDIGFIYRVSIDGNYTAFPSADPSNTPRAASTTPVQGSDGKIYCASAVNNLTRDVVSSFDPGTGNYNILKLFLSSANDGFTARGGVMQALDGNLYGTTYSGGSGSSGDGTIYKLTTGGVFTVLRRFSRTTDGANSRSQLVQGADGFLYGTCQTGGAYSQGTIFRIATDGTGFLNLHDFNP